VNDASAAHAVAKTKLHLASLYIEGGRAREAARLKIPAVFNQLEGPDDQARARAMLGSLALSENDLPRAEEMFLGVLSYWQSNSTQAKAYMEIATALNNLGIVAWRQGRNDLALSRLMESLNVWKTALGPDNVTLAKAMNNLAVVYAEAKRYGEAVEWQAQATTVAQRVFGDVHPFTITMQTFYAEALKKAGRKAEASQIARAAAESRKIVRRTSVADYTLDYRDVKGRSK
jgi:tetratricopeptide (TPR) repeat protein